MAITSIKTGSSFTNLIKYNDFLAGNAAYPGPFAYTQTGGTVSTSGAYTLLTFTGSGNFTITAGSKSCDILAIGGGAGGYYGSTVNVSNSESTNGIGGGGGGGAGRYNYLTAQTLTTASYTVTIGAGGSAGATFYGSYANAPTAGGTTLFGSVTTATGGSIGGDGYGSSGYLGGGYGGTSGNGYAGGTAPNSYGYGGGGGGSAGAGTSSNVGATGFIGGAGTANSISGTSITYAWGGTAPNSANTAPADAPGRGGYGGYDLNAPAYGNLQYSAGGAGAAGIVIVRWLT
jgi:hypothetical protein